jgi:hypothetical protein
MRVSSTFGICGGFIGLALTLSLDTSRTTEDWRPLAAPVEYWDDAAGTGDTGNDTLIKNKFGKRDTYNSWVEKGRLLQCLVQATQDDANAIAAKTPSLSGLNGNVASPYGQFPESLTLPGWFVAIFLDSEINEGLKDTADGRNSIGGAAANNADFVGVTDEWISFPVKDPSGNQVVGYCLLAILWTLLVSVEKSSGFLRLTYRRMTRGLAAATAISMVQAVGP